MKTIERCDKLIKTGASRLDYHRAYVPKGGGK
jgi:hypothetical protein